MKLLVAAKVVPPVEAARFQPGLNRIVRAGVPGLVNPLDLVALRVALLQRERHGGEVVVVSMGPPEAGPALEELAALGPDRVVHLCDERLAGADTLATARALARVLHHEQADLVLCGRVALDGGTAQVPAQLAALAGLCFVGNALELEVDGRSLNVVEEVEAATRAWRVELPAVVSVEPAALGADPVASPGGRAIETWDLDRLGGEEAAYGIRGSRTYVQAVEETKPERRGRVVGCRDGVRLVEAAGRAERGANAEAGAGSAPPPGRSEPGGDRALWVVAEHEDGILDPSAFEGIACAAAVARPLGAEVVAVLLCDEPAAMPAALAARGAERTIVATAPQLRGQLGDVMAAALAPLVRERAPVAVIAPWSSRGRHYLPQVAAQLDLGLTGDVVGLDVAPHPVAAGALDIAWLKPAWAGTAVARVVARTSPSLGTLRPGCVDPLADRPGRTSPVDEVVLDHETLASVAARRDAATSESEGSPLERAKVLVCVGPAVPPAVVGLLAAEADRRGWALAGSHGAVVAGLVAPADEVSLVKRSIAPLVFVGVDLEGPSDLAAVRGAGVVVTVAGVTEPGLAQASDLVVEASAAEFAAALGEERRGGAGQAR